MLKQILFSTLIMFSAVSVPLHANELPEGLADYLLEQTDDGIQGWDVTMCVYTIAVAAPHLSYEKIGQLCRQELRDACFN